MNILVVSGKENPNWKTVNVWELKVKLADFGLARVNQSSPQGSISMTAIGGTPGYWAPEMLEALLNRQQRLKSHFSLDSFAMGVICYELTTGGIEAGRFLSNKFYSYGENVLFIVVFISDQSKYTDASAMRSKFQGREPNLVSFLAATTDKDWRNRQDVRQLLQHAFIKDGEKYVEEEKQRGQREQLDRAKQQMQAKIQQLQQQAKADIQQLQRQTDSEVSAAQQQLQQQIDSLLAQLLSKIEEHKRKSQERIDQVKSQTEDQIKQLNDQMRLMQVWNSYHFFVAAMWFVLLFITVHVRLVTVPGPKQCPPQGRGGNYPRRSSREVKQIFFQE